MFFGIRILRIAVLDGIVIFEFFLSLIAIERMLRFTRREDNYCKY